MPSKVKTILFIILFLSSRSIYSAKIIFDLGGVLLNQNSPRAYPYFISTIGFYNIIKFYCFNSSISKAYNRIFEFGNLIFKNDCSHSWFSGEISSDELVSTVSDNIYKKEYDNFFKNNAEREFMAQGVKLFIPENLCKITNITKEGFEVVKACHKKGHELFILSNWDAISFALVESKFPELFGLFKPENIVISGRVNCAKPDSEIFKLITKNNKTEECYFIDDKQENINVANKLGMCGIRHVKWNSTQEVLKRLYLI